MPSDNQIDIRDARGATRGIVTRQVLSRNGSPVLDADDQPVTEDNAPRAEVVALGIPQGTDGNVDDVSAANPLPSADYSPPLTALAHIGTDLTASTDTVIVVADGRVKVDLCHAGTAGRVWIGVGRAAQVGVGNYLEAGDVWSEWTAGAVHVLLDGTGSAQRITGMEWAA